jgi:small multidrug resistance pump
VLAGEGSFPVDAGVPVGGWYGPNRLLARQCLGFFPSAFVPESGFMCWLWLLAAIVLEVTATLLLKLSNGFTRVGLTAAMASCYVGSFYLMAISLKQMEVGTVYAVWSALGTALVVGAGVLFFRESMTAMKLVSITLIVLGVISLNLSTLREKPKEEPGVASVATAELEKTQR